MMMLKDCIIIVVMLIQFWVTTDGQEDYTSSICHTTQYRMLSFRQQNEHQCMVLEKLHQDFDKERNMIRSQYTDLYSMLNNFQKSMYKKIASLSSQSRGSARSMPNLNDIPLVRDCSELQQHAITISGVYPISLPNSRIVNVWCDMDTSDGGWTVIQRRVNGEVNFTRKWDDYAFGFGNVNAEYWLGNEHLYWLTHNKNYSIQFDLWDWEDGYAYALYDNFRVQNEQQNYQLTIRGYSGTAGDAMFPYHDGMRFSTLDRDNDEWHSNCAKKDQSGWWFKACSYASLNGVYIKGGTNKPSPDGVIKGILWSKWKEEFGYSMKRTEIKIKPRIQIQYDRKKNKTSDTESDNDKPETIKTDESESLTNSTENIDTTENGDTAKNNDTAENGDTAKNNDTSENDSTAENGDEAVNENGDLTENGDSAENTTESSIRTESVQTNTQETTSTSSTEPPDDYDYNYGDDYDDY